MSLVWIVAVSVLEIYFRRRLRTLTFDKRLKWGTFSGSIFAVLVFGIGLILFLNNKGHFIIGLFFIVTFIGGSLNVLVMHANGGRMPVQYFGSVLTKEEANLTLLLLYMGDDEELEKNETNPNWAMEIMAKTYDPHCPLPGDSEHSLLHSETKFKYLADIFPFRFPIRKGIHSIGDVLMYAGLVGISLSLVLPFIFKPA